MSKEEKEIEYDEITYTKDGKTRIKKKIAKPNTEIYNSIKRAYGSLKRTFKGENIIANGIALNTPEKLVKHYKKQEKINIKTIIKELSEKPLEVFFMFKGGFIYEEENGYDKTWYDFMDKNGKVYTMIKREIDKFEFEDNIKPFDIVKISVINGMIGIKWEK